MMMIDRYRPRKIKIVEIKYKFNNNKKNIYNIYNKIVVVSGSRRGTHDVPDYLSAWTLGMSVCETEKLVAQGLVK